VFRRPFSSFSFSKLVKEVLMRKVVAILSVLIIAFPLLAAKDKKKDWQMGTLVEVKTQYMQSSAYANPNSSARQSDNPMGAVDPSSSGRGPVGGSFSSAPTHFIIYNILLDTGEEMVIAKLSREATARPPDLKTGEIKWKRSGPKFIEVMDQAGKKFDFEVVKRQKKSEQGKKR
jgi:hypothetical protein